jgi:hypothetical protein
MHRRRYKQLKLEVEPYREQFNSLWLSFKLGKHPVQGLLIGASHDWCFQSTSPAFLKQIPTGVLRKYALWFNGVPKNISSIYNNILEAALREGYDLTEKEEVQN